MGRMSDGSSVPRDAQPGGQVVLEPKLPVGGVPCLAGISAYICIPSVLSHQFGDAYGKCGVCANPGVDPGEQHLGPSVNDAPCSRIQAAHFHDCKNPPPSCLTDLLLPAIQGTASSSVVPEKRG